MLKADYHKNFKKDYKKLTKAVQGSFRDRFILFLRNPQDLTLKDHALKGLLNGKRAFSVTGDVRVIYRFIDKDTLILLRIGTHNQVY